MPVHFNQDEIAPEPAGKGATVKRLLTPERTGNDMISLSLWSLEAGARTELALGIEDVGTIQLLSGAGELLREEGGGENQARDAAGSHHVFFLPPGFSGRLVAEEALQALVTIAPRVRRFDKSWDASRLGYRRIDWTAEPMLDSGHDTRKRIYLVTPALCDTKAMKAEMIIYPPGAVASNHHHEGAEHFQYVLRGEATVFLSEQPRLMRAGDVLYSYEFERHYMANETDTEFAFVEYFVPGSYRTEWVDGKKICTWTPTGKSVTGKAPVRDIGAHSSAEAAGRSDV